MGRVTKVREWVGDELVRWHGWRGRSAEVEEAIYACGCHICTLVSWVWGSRVEGVRFLLAGGGWRVGGAGAAFIHNSRASLVPALVWDVAALAAPSSPPS